MARAAGNDTHYKFALNGDEELGVIALPSVTSIIGRVLSKPALVNWAYKLGVEGLGTPDEVSGVRMLEGSVAHEYLEELANLIIAGEENDFPEPETGWERGIFHWVFTEAPPLVASEQVLYSLRHLYAGTCDLVVRTDEGLVIVDLKTRKPGDRCRAYDSELIQVSAYKIAYEEMFGVPVVGTALLIVEGDGTYKYVERTVTPDLFLHILDVYRLLKEEHL